MNDEFDKMWHTFDDGVRRIRDVDLARMLGIKPSEIRRFIEEHRHELERFGPVLSMTVVENRQGEKGGQGETD